MKKIMKNKGLIVFNLQVLDINTLEYAAIFNTALDQIMIEEATSGWMEANAGLVKYTGGDEVKIPTLNMDGLGDYKRGVGYVGGAVDFSYKTYTMTQDRGRAFNLDKRDVDETNFGVTAGSVVAEFGRTKQVPELDAYRYSKIFALANGDVDRVDDYTPLETTIWKQLTSDIAKIQDLVGESVPLVISMRIPVANILDNNTDIAKRLGVAEFTQGSLVTTVKTINEVPIKRVPTARMKTEYLFLDGETGGQEAGGFEPTALAANINYIISARVAPVAVAKIDEMKIITPEVNQTYSGYSIFFRNFHELWVLDNKLPTLLVSYEGIAAPALTATVAAGTGTGNTKFTATAEAGNTLAYTLTVAAEEANYNADSASIAGLVSPYTSAADIAATAGQFLNMYELNSLGQVQKFATHELESGDISS